MSNLRISLWSLRQLIHTAPFISIFLLLLIFVQGIVPGLSLFVIERLVNWISLNSNVSNFPLVLVILWGGVLFIDFALSPLVSVIRIHLNEKILTHYNILLMEKANSFEGLEPFEDAGFYDQVQFLKEESKRKPLNFVYIIVGCLKDIFSLASIIFILATTSFWIPFFILLASIPHAYSTMRLEKISWDQMLFRSPQARKMAWFSSITLDNKVAQEIRLFGFGGYLIRCYKELAGTFHDEFKAKRLKQCFISIVLSSFTIVGYLAIFTWIILEAVNLHISTGVVVITLQAFVMVQSQISAFMQDIAMLFPVLGFFKKLKEFVEKKFLIDSSTNSNAQSFDGFSKRICFENVSFSYQDGRKVLSQINLIIEPKEKIAIVGENGAGKSTLVKLLMRLYDPTEGRITVDGIDLRNIELQSWRNQISAVFQDFCQYNMTVQENIGLGDIQNMHSKEKINSAAKKGGFSDVIDGLPNKLNTLIGKEFGGTSLSGGEWQKLAMSRAFMKKAEILILDEPTASLDPKSEYQVFQKFSENTENKTTIFITHRLGSVMMADRIIVMKNGKIIEQGTHDALINHESDYKKYFVMQAAQYMTKLAGASK